MASYLIRREKAPPPPALGGAAVHYATGVAPWGLVTGWTADRGLALAVPEDAARRTVAWYASRHAAGTVSAEPAAGGPALPAPPPPATPDDGLAAAIAEIDRLTATVTSLNRAVEAAESVSARERAEARKTQAELDEATAERDRLKAQVEGLRRDLEEATRPAAPPPRDDAGPSSDVSGLFEEKPQDGPPAKHEPKKRGRKGGHDDET